MIVNADITLYNRRYDKDTRLDNWNKTVIEGVHFYADTKVAIADKGLQSADVFKIRIPIDAQCIKTYIPASEYKMLDDISGYWTLQNDDYVIKGISDKEIEKQSELINAIKITSFADNRFGGQPHWRIGGE